MSSKAFPGFTKLSKSVLVREGSKEAPPHDHPAAIVFATWMLAPPKLTLKYLDGYAELYPKTPILLINSTNAIFTSSQKDLEAAVEPAVSWLRKHDLIKERKRSRLLVHLMSNGGGIQGCNLAKTLRAQESSKEPAFPARAYILDSLPARPGYRGFAAANTAHLKGLAQKLPVYLLIALLHVFGLLWYNAIVRKPDPLTQERIDLLDDSLFDQKAPKTYIYSPADQVTAAKEVEDHVADAQQRGSPVHTVVFKRSPHVSHIREDPKKYWEAIKQAYERGG